MLLKPQEIPILCQYSQEDTDIEKLIQASFRLFLARELAYTEKNSRCPSPPSAGEGR